MRKASLLCKNLAFAGFIFSVGIFRAEASAPFDRESFLDERIISNEWDGWFPVMGRYLLIRRNRSAGYNPIRGFTWELRLCQEGPYPCENLGQIRGDADARDRFVLFLEERVEELDVLEKNSSIWRWKADRFLKMNKMTLDRLSMKLSEFNSFDIWFGSSDIDCDLYGAEEFERLVAGIKEILIARPSQLPIEVEDPPIKPIDNPPSQEEQMAGL